MRDVARFAVGIAIFHCNYEVLCQQGREDINLSFLVGSSPFFFESTNLRGSAGGFFRNRVNREKNEQNESEL